MATLQVTVPDAVVQRIQDAFTATPEFTESGMSANQWIQKKLKDHIRDTVMVFEASKASLAAQQKAMTDLG